MSYFINGFLMGFLVGGSFFLVTATHNQTSMSRRERVVQDNGGLLGLVAGLATTISLVVWAWA